MQRKDLTKSNTLHNKQNKTLSKQKNRNFLTLTTVLQKTPTNCIISSERLNAFPQRQEQSRSEHCPASSAVCLRGAQQEGGVKGVRPRGRSQAFPGQTRDTCCLHRRAGQARARAHEPALLSAARGRGASRRWTPAPFPGTGSLAGPVLPGPLRAGVTPSVTPSLSPAPSGSDIPTGCRHPIQSPRPPAWALSPSLGALLSLSSHLQAAHHLRCALPGSSPLGPPPCPSSPRGPASAF